MKIRILGPLEVVAGGEPLSLGGMRERALLAVLALAPGQVLSSDRLIDQLWGEELPGNPQNALQAVVSRLRRTLGGEFVVTRSPGYVLAVEPSAVDAELFRSLVSDARNAEDPQAKARRFGEALALWRGPALVDFAAEEFAQREIAALEELRLLALEGRIAADLELGGGAELVPELEQLIAEYPLRESLRVSQMLALYRSGRQAEALRAFTSARRVLGEELGIEPGPELRAMEESILMHDPALRVADSLSQEMPGALIPPPLPVRLASFIGRSSEIDEVVEALNTSRLVTLTGAGGAGKTSLAVEAARSIVARYPDGAWMVDLTPVVDPVLVPAALMTALQLEHATDLVDRRQVDPLQASIEYLRHRSALLIVDNCEHVIGGASKAVEAILLSCPQVDVLATSRDRLGIAGELLWRIPALGLPDGDEASDATRLFIERARAVNSVFEANAEERIHIGDICRKLDGMPLAIELAAARARSLPVAEIARRLESGITILSGGPRHGSRRQQTLQATIDWSYRLLTPHERELFDRLSVFHGTFALDAAEAVAPERMESQEVLVHLERLIDSSMVSSLRIGSGGAMRYRMLETLRTYACDNLAASGATDSVTQQLLDHLLVALAPAEEALRGPEQLVWLEKMDADHDTIRSVLEWSVSHAPSRGLQLAGSLGWYWYLKGSGNEARERFETLLAAAGSTADPFARAQAHFFHSLHDPRPERARSGFEAAHAGYLEAGDQRGVAHALAMIAAWGFDSEEARALTEQAAELCEAAGYDWGGALIRFLQAGIAMVANDVAESSRLAEEAAARFAGVGDRWGEAYSSFAAGVAKRAMGDYEAAEKALNQALERGHELRLRREIAPVLCEMASIATMRGEYERAATMLEQAREYADEVPFAGSQGMVRNAQGKLARLQGDLESAVRLHEEAFALYRDGERHGGIAYSLSCLGFATEVVGDLDAAVSHHSSALEHAQAADDVFAVALGLEGIGATLVAAGDAERGVKLISAGLSAREKSGVPLPAGEWADIDRACEAASQQLGAVEFAAALETGRSLDLDQAIELATT
jgi:predicted ATPase/DNA-binding SARP family transcriptional activator